MKSIKLHSLFIAVSLLCFAVPSFGRTQFRVLTGTKQQTFNNNSQEQVGSSPLGLITFVDFEILRKTYFSFGTSFEMSTENFSTSGFTIYGSGVYYLYGYPKTINSNTNALNMDLFYPYSVYVSAGIFQKQIKVRTTNNGVLTEDLGGLQAGLGVNYNLNSKMYISGHLQTLMSGSSSADYSSFEFYAGLGLRL